MLNMNLDTNGEGKKRDRQGLTEISPGEEEELLTVYKPNGKKTEEPITVYKPFLEEEEEPLPVYKPFIEEEEGPVYNPYVEEEEEEPLPVYNPYVEEEEEPLPVYNPYGNDDALNAAVPTGPAPTREQVSNPLTQR